MTIAENGKQALAALEKHKFDLVLMDVQMPEMGGIEATQIIRERESETGQHVRIVAMTAHAMRGDRERCLQAGMDGYLAKPLDPRTFLQTVETIAAPGAAGATSLTAPLAAAAAAASATGPAGAQDGAASVEANSAAPADDSQPAAAAPAIAFDDSALLARFSGNEKLLQSLVTTFLEDCPKMVERIRRALQSRNPAAVAETAHALKGSVGNFGSSPVFETARALEMAGRKGTLEGSWEAFATLEDQLASLSPLLARHGEPERPKGRRGSPQHSPRRKR